jgi:hypothetical protein
MAVNWNQFPVEPPAAPGFIAGIVSLSDDRELIYRLSYPESLLKAPGTWTSEILCLLTSRGQAELRLWLSRLDDTSPCASGSTVQSPIKRRVHFKCNFCQLNDAGYAQAPFSMYCSKRCRSMKGASRYTTSPTISTSFGPAHLPSPISCDNSITGPTRPATSVTSNLTGVSTDSSSSSDDNTNILQKNMDLRMTMMQLKVMMSLRNISVGKGSSKRDRISTIIASYGSQQDGITKLLSDIKRLFCVEIDSSEEVNTPSNINRTLPPSPAELTLSEGSELTLSEGSESEHTPPSLDPLPVSWFAERLWKMTLSDLNQLLQKNSWSEFKQKGKDRKKQLVAFLSQKFCDNPAKWSSSK